MLLIAFLIGILITFYPVISKYWNAYRAQQLNTEYDRAVVTLGKDSIVESFEAAKAYNDQHICNVIIDAFGENDDEYILTHPYDTLLNPSGNEVMGHLEIPKIRVDLPIYHGIGASTLEKGIGHIEGTSLPIGGKGTHSVLCGHSGLPNMKLLSDLDQVKEGDQFYLHVLDDTLAYEVDQILTVLPDETDSLAIEPDEDLVTLVTCTPYAVNTHRLLVRGHRVPYVEEEREAETPGLFDRLRMMNLEEYLLAGGLSIFLILLIVMIIRSRRQEKKQ